MFLIFNLAFSLWVLVAAVAAAAWMYEAVHCDRDMYERLFEQYRKDARRRIALEVTQRIAEREIGDV